MGRAVFLYAAEGWAHTEIQQKHSSHLKCDAKEKYFKCHQENAAPMNKY